MLIHRLLSSLSPRVCRIRVGGNKPLCGHLRFATSQEPWRAQKNVALRPVLRSPPRLLVPGGAPSSEDRGQGTGTRRLQARCAARQRPQFSLLQNGRVSRPVRPRALPGRGGGLRGRPEGV